ncbi:hypothetical protein ABIE35_000290 [Paenarthrobacter sp. 4246]
MRKGQAPDDVEFVPLHANYALEVPTRVDALG